MVEKEIYMDNKISMKKNIPELIPAIIAVVLSVGVMTVFRACAKAEDGTWMNCHYAQLFVFAGGGIMTAISLAAAFIKNSRLKMCVGIVAIIIAVITALIPGVLVHLCMMDTMRCHMLMRPAVDILCVLFIIIELVNGFFVYRKGKAA